MSEIENNVSVEQVGENENVVTEAANAPSTPSGAEVSSPADAYDEDAILDAILAGEEVEKTEAKKIESVDEVIANNSEEVAESDDEMLRALRRDGVPQTVIDQISKDPELLAEWATKAIKRQSDVDAYTEKMRELEGVTATNESDVSEPTDAEEESTEGTTPLDALADEIGEEAIEPIRQMQQELTELRAQLDEANRRVVMSEVQQAVEQAAPKVLAKWGNVTADKKSKVIERMSELGKAQPRTFSSIDDLMHVAAKQVLGEPSVTKRSATPSPPKRSAKIERTATKEEAEDAALDILLGGGTVDQAKAAMR